MHNVDDKYSKITEGGATRSQVGERLVTWCVDDKEAGKLQIEWLSRLHHIDVLLQVVLGEVGRTDLLRDTASFVCLDVGLSQTIEDERLTGIDVTHNTYDGASEALGLLLWL